MKISEFAERILLSPSIEDKLRPAGIFDFSSNKDFGTLPELPLRSDDFAFGKKSKKEIPMGTLESESDRGHLLLFFMNHELLAIELMALALLKFQNSAPESFLRGLLSTLADEQKHCRLYLNRLKQLGVQAGDLPLSRFFWDCMVNIEHPQEYLAGMALTLEQANLDFTLFYQKRFHEVNDSSSVKILQTVYEDEIRHVAFGVSWLNQWKTPGTELWDYYLAHLPKRLNPARARGHFYFDESGRQEAGMSSKDILNFKLHNSSRGRSPDIWHFNPAVELEVAGLATPPTFKKLQHDLSLLMMAMSKRDDVVLVNQAPSTSQRNKLHQAGFSLPEFKEVSKCAELKEQHKINQFLPWGLSPQIKHFNKSLSPRNHHKLWQQDWKKFYSKSYQANFWQNQSIETHNNSIDLSAPKVIQSLEALHKTLNELEQEGHAKAFLKAPFGCTGRNCRTISFPLEREDDLNWIQGILKKQKELSVEPWRDIIYNLSAQFTLCEQGRCKLEGLTLIEMLNEKANAGNICGPFIKYLSKEVKSLLCSGSKNLAREYFTKCAQFWAKEMSAHKFHGPFGLDGFIWKDTSNKLHFRPICELNPRITMGRIALEFTKQCSPGSLTKLSILHRSQQVDKFIETELQFDKSSRLASGQMILNGQESQPDFSAFFSCGSKYIFP